MHDFLVTDLREESWIARSHTFAFSKLPVFILLFFFGIKHHEEGNLQKEMFISLMGSEK